VPYARQAKPANFLLVAHVATGGHPQGADAGRFALIAPYQSDPRARPNLKWNNVYEPE